MSWSWKLGRIAGIPVYVHWTFSILIAWVVVNSWLKSGDVGSVAVAVGFMIAVFTCIVFHELGHALTARRFGVRTSDITLLPIGGVARLERIPERPWQELLIALAGPAVNVVIVAILGLLGVRFSQISTINPEVKASEFLPILMMFNTFMAAFNMLPAFPMDGGRVLRALLALRLPYARATRLAASVGQVMAIFFGLWGLTVSNPFLLLIAIFVWIGAEAEAAGVEERLLLKGVPVRAAMLTDFHTLGALDPLSHAVELLLAGTQHDFPVLSPDGRALQGVLTRSDLMAGLASGGRDAPVRDYIKSEIHNVEVESPLTDAIVRLRSGEGPCLQVVDRGRPVGLLTPENVAEYLMVRAALAGGSAAGQGAPPGRVALEATSKS
jgi:Zn-dependent protease/CBS domain-containing protein